MARALILANLTSWRLEPTHIKHTFVPNGIQKVRTKETILAARLPQTQFNMAQGIV